ncbi:MAG: hypothetical protein V1872_02650 [bacterium]
MPKKGIIISAQGEKSFSQQQVTSIKRMLDVYFHPQLTELPSKEFIHLCQEYKIVGVTRRTIKDIDKDIIQSLPSLQGLAIYATGYEWVDLDVLNKTSSC